MRDVRQRQSGKPCSPESRSDAGQSSPSAGRKPGTGPPGRKPRVSRAASLPEALGETPLPGLSRLAEASAVLGQWPRFVSSKPAAWHLEPPSALPVPACSPSWPHRAHLHGPGRSSCLEAVRVATSVLLLAALRHSRGCQEEERGHFGGPLSCLTHLVSLKAICSGYT